MNRRTLSAPSTAAASELEIAVSEIERAALSMLPHSTIVTDATASSSSSRLEGATAEIVASEIHRAIKGCLNPRDYNSTRRAVPKANALLNLLSSVPTQQVSQIRSILIRAPSVIIDTRRLLLSTEEEGFLWLWDMYPESIPLQVSLCMGLYPFLNISIADFFLSALGGWTNNTVGAAFTNPDRLLNLETGALFSQFDKSPNREKMLLTAIEQQNDIRRAIRNYLEWCLSDASVLARLIGRVESPEMRQVGELLGNDIPGTSCVQHTLLDLVGSRLSPVLANTIVRNFEFNSRTGVLPVVLLCTHPDIFLHTAYRLPVRDDDKLQLLGDAIECNIRYDDALALRPSDNADHAALYRPVLLAAQYGRLDILRMLFQSPVIPPDFVDLVVRHARADMLYEIDESVIFRDIDMSAFDSS